MRKATISLFFFFLCLQIATFQQEISTEEYEKRRLDLMQLVKEDIIVIPCVKAESKARGLDYNTFVYDFYYLTGFLKYKSILVLVPGDRLSILFSDEDPQKLKSSGIKDVLPLESFERLIKEVVDERTKVSIWRHPFRTKKSKTQLERFIEKSPGKVTYDVQGKLATLRVIKAEDEIECIKKAASITCQAIEEAIKKCKPTMNEKDLASIIEKAFKANKCDTVFPSIIGSGRNSTELHYSKNRDTLHGGSLVLMDVGARFNQYCADIARTIPVSGRFADEQKKIYQAVLDSLKAAEAILKPGVTMADLHKAAANVIEEKGLTKWSFAHSKDPTVNHSLCHFIGLGLHDVGGYSEKLKSGMVICMEPGIYDKDKDIGVRTEDMYLITETGFERFSKDLPREIEQIEEMMKK